MEPGLMGFFGQVAQWFANPHNWTGSGGIPARVAEHVAMSAAAMAIALLISLPIGLYLGHTGRGGLLAINLSNIGRAIPSFALIVFLILILGLGAAPTFVALLVLAIPPVLTNTYQGIRQVDPGLVDAARGMGMRERQILLQVELPVAVPVIMAGVRTAAVQVVATATIAAEVAWGGLGRFIVDGLAFFQYQQVFAGAVLVALLAGATEGILALVQRLLTPRGLRKVSASRAARQAERTPSMADAAA